MSYLFAYYNNFENRKMRVINLAIVALIGSAQAVKYIDNNLYAKMTGRAINQDNAGNLAYDEIYNMSEEKD